MIRFVILFSWELLKGFVRACWVRLGEIWSGELAAQGASARFRVGAVVRYVCQDGKRRAAIIIALGEDTMLGQCALLAWTGEQNDCVFFDPDTKARGTWHWGDGARTL